METSVCGGAMEGGFQLAAEDGAKSCHLQHHTESPTENTNSVLKSLPYILPAKWSPGLVGLER